MAKKTKTNNISTPKSVRTKANKCPKKAITIKKKASPRKAEERPPKIIGDLHSKSPEARAIYKKRSYYKHHKETLMKQKEYDARCAQKKNQEFLDYYDKTYPLKDV